jgi:serine/threonine protein kinase
LTFPLSVATISVIRVYLLLQPNVLIDNETPPRARISDFGLCAVAQTASLGPGGVGDSVALGYMAPELFSEDVQASKEADMYAFGMMVYEVIAGASPFAHRKLVELLAFSQGSRPPRPEEPVAIGFDQGTWEFAERCWDKDPKQRPTAREALEHFERVARTSKVVDPGPTMSIHEPIYSGVGGSSRGFCECNHRYSASVLTVLQLNYPYYRRRIVQAGSNGRFTPRVYYMVIRPSPSQPSTPTRNLPCCFT